MTNLASFIKSNFKIDDPKDLESVASLFKFSILKRGEQILTTGQQCYSMNLVQSGFLRIFNITEGNEVTQWIATKGTFATDLSSFFSDTPARWIIQALVDTELYTISKKDYKKIVDVVPKWNEVEKIFLVNCFTTMENRIYSHLSMSAQERYNYFFENNRELFNQVPLKHIASMLGMTPETMSRIRIK
ncbi:MAG: CRP-like cAMP-binding protein [Psychromonas sp.]|jgi:CRP-like cAMP-binding protein